MCPPLQVSILFENREHGGTLTRFIPVDKHMTELTLSLSGDKNDEDLLDLTLKDPTGECQTPPHVQKSD